MWRRGKPKRPGEVQKRKSGLTVAEHFIMCHACDIDSHLYGYVSLLMGLWDTMWPHTPVMVESVIFTGHPIVTKFISVLWEVIRAHTHLCRNGHGDTSVYPQAWNKEDCGILRSIPPWELLGCSWVLMCFAVPEMLLLSHGNILDARWFLAESWCQLPRITLRWFIHQMAQVAGQLHICNLCLT